MKNKQSFMIAVILASNSLLSFSQRTYPVPETTGFAIAEDALSTDTMYLYNVGAKAYFTEGNSWGTQASVGDAGLKVFFEKYDDPEETDWDGKTYLIWDFSLYKNQWMNLFIDSETEIYVDHGSQGGYCWLFQIEDNGNGTFKIHAADDSKYSHTNYPGTYIGVVEYADGTMANTISPLLNPDEMGNTRYAAYHTDWAFVSKADYEAHQKKLKAYRASQQLLATLEKTKAFGLDTAAEQAVYDNTKSSIEEMQDAVVSLKEKTALYYETAITPSSPMSMDEEYVINTTFDTDHDGWTSTTGCQNNLIATNQCSVAGSDGNFYFTTAFWENWNPSGFTGKMYRQMEYMPKGVYRLELSAFANAGQGSYVYINYDSVEVVSGGRPEKYEVVSVNDSGTAEIGLKEVIGYSNWVGIDNCHLIYYGNNKEAYAYLIDWAIDSFSTDAQFYNRLREEYEAIIKDYAHPETLEEAKNYDQIIKAKQKEIADCIKAYEELRRMVDDIKQAMEQGYDIEDFGKSAVDLALEADEIMKEGGYTAEEALSTLGEIRNMIRVYKTDISTPNISDSPIPVEIYQLTGQRVNATTPSKGIHIIRYSDGTVKKVYTR